MPRLAPLDDPEAPSAVQGLYQAIQSKFKMVPNFFRMLGHVPEVLQATLDFDKAIQRHLDPKLRELAYLKTAMVLGCEYCQHYHKAASRWARVSAAQVEDLGRFEESPAYSDLEKNVLRFAEQWTRQGKVDQAVVDQLGVVLKPEQLVALAATVGLANWTGRFNVTFGVQLP